MSLTLPPDCVTSTPPVTVKSVDASAAPRWSEFVGRMPGAELYHDYRWRGVIDTVFGHETFYLLAQDSGGECRGALPLVRLRSWLFGDFLVSLPFFNYGGALAETAAARDALLAAARVIATDGGSSHVELRHRDGAALGLPCREDKATLLLDLPDTEKALWEGFPAKLRSQVRRPQKEGCEARYGGVELIDDFYTVFARNMRDLGTPVYPRRFFAAILAAFPAEASICVISHRARPVAAGFMVGHRATLEIPWASSLREANRLSANMLLYWSVLSEAVRRGFRRFDFGRSTLDSGTYRFKRQWGAVPQQLRWFYLLGEGEPLPRITPTNPKYRAAVAAWQKLPLPIANWLGPHLVRNLP